MSAALQALLGDLAAETEVLSEVLTGLDPDRWEYATPADGWSVRDQVSHLAFFDQAAVTAATDPDVFCVDAAALVELGPQFPDVVAERFRTMPVPELYTWFAAARADLLSTFAAFDGNERVPWFGPSMSVMSSATARLMETWAHGQDVYDTFGLSRPPTARLKHIAHLGVRTLGFSFLLNERELPELPVRVELLAPDGSTWTWGEPEAGDVVRGSAEDFCLVVTQRRHPLDTDLVVTGSTAAAWISIAQSFAGAPGRGRDAIGPYLKESS
ncbi:MAG: hypothetical protein JWR52_2132 [Marmoricola sp.]|nr:hypothetical protein [Marmoricola sp.]